MSHQFLRPGYKAAPMHKHHPYVQLHMNIASYLNWFCCIFIIAASLRDRQLCLDE